MLSHAFFKFDQQLTGRVFVQNWPNSCRIPSQALICATWVDKLDDTLNTRWHTLSLWWTDRDESNVEIRKKNLIHFSRFFRSCRLLNNLSTSKFKIFRNSGKNSFLTRAEYVSQIFKNFIRKSSPRRFWYSRVNKSKASFRFDGKHG